MIFKNRNCNTSHQLLYNNHPLERVSEYKYLGLIITENFKWDAHIDLIKDKITPYIFCLRKLRNVLPRKALKLIYYAYIHSQIIYLNPVWSGCSKFKLNQLFVLQKRAIKYVMGVHWRHPSENLFKNGFKSILLIIEEELLVLIYKIVNNLIKHNYELTQIKSIHTHNTRRRSHYTVQFFSSNISDQNIFYKGLIEFNKLPSNIKNANNICIFKKTLFEYLSEKNKQLF